MATTSRARATGPTFGRPSRRLLQIFAAVPAGSVRAPSQARFLRAVQDRPELAILRADAYRNLLAVAWCVARYADWTSLCARPTWQVIAAQTGLSESTVNRCLRRLRGWGLLGVVETGSTEATRRALPAGHPDRVEGNRAAEYVLCVAAPQVIVEPQVTHHVDGTDLPSLFPKEQKKDPTREHASENTPNRENRTVFPQVGQRGIALQACAALRADDLTLRRCSSRMLRHLLAPLLAAGATAGDVRHILHHAPDGTVWPYTSVPAHVPGWIRWRITHWLTPDGALRAPLPSLAAVQRQTEAHTRQAAMRAQTAAERLTATNHTTSHAAAARTLLTATSPGARKVLARTRKQKSINEEGPVSS